MELIDFEIADGITEIIELLGVIVIGMGVFMAFATSAYKRYKQPGYKIYRPLKLYISKSLLLGLELLLAADIIRTVTLERTLESLVGLSLLVLIRTFLAWTITLDTEGRWPWQPEHKREK